MDSSESEQSLAFSGLFDLSVATFDTQNSTATEESGFYTTTISRPTGGKVGIAFVETALGTADRLDVVPYRGPVTFNSTATSTSIFVQIKSDNIQEEDENFEKLRKEQSADIQILTKEE